MYKGDIEWELSTKKDFVLGFQALLAYLFSPTASQKNWHGEQTCASLVPAGSL